ncbi:MAG TPA: DUF2062 domain-containing protein [Opitutaceae bacterium]
MSDWRQRGFAWIQRRAIDPVLAQLRQGLSRKSIAFSLIVGALCAFFPVLGLATPVCLLAGFAFRLNHPILQAVNLATSPLYVPVVYGMLRIGNAVLGSPHGSWPVMAGHAVVGWLVVAPIWLGIGFPVIYALLGSKAVSEWSLELPAAWAVANPRRPACLKSGGFVVSTRMRSFGNRS